MSTPARSPTAGAARVVTERIVRPVASRRSWLSEHMVVLMLLVLGAGCSLASVAVFAEVYESVSEQGGLARFDQPALEAALRLRTPGRAHGMTVFTDLGGPVGYAIMATLVLGVCALLLRSWEPIALGVPAIAVALGMSLVGKQIVGRTRPPRSEAVPPYESSASFPSGHTILATVLMGVLIYLASRHLRRPWLRATAIVVCACWAAAMGLSRVYLGHHWLTDVAAGWSLGIAWVLALVTLHQAWLLARGGPPD